MEIQKKKKNSGDLVYALKVLSVLNHSFNSSLLAFLNTEHILPSPDLLERTMNWADWGVRRCVKLSLA